MIPKGRNYTKGQQRIGSRGNPHEPISTLCAKISSVGEREREREKKGME